MLRPSLAPLGWPHVFRGPITSPFPPPPRGCEALGPCHSASTRSHRDARAGARGAPLVASVRPVRWGSPGAMTPTALGADDGVGLFFVHLSTFCADPVPRPSQVLPPDQGCFVEAAWEPQWLPL